MKIFMKMTWRPSSRCYWLKKKCFDANELILAVTLQDAQRLFHRPTLFSKLTNLFW